MISWCLCILLHLDPSLRSPSRALVWATQEGAKVQVGERAHRDNEEAQRNVCNDTSFTKSHIQGRRVHLRDSGYESNKLDGLSTKKERMVHATPSGSERRS